MKRFIWLILIGSIWFTGCKEDEDPQPDPYVSYSSRIIGTWSVSSITDKTSQSTETYPLSLDEFLITFTSESKLNVEGPCNVGGAQSYLVSESGGIQINGYATTKLFCSNDESDWEAYVETLMKNAYHSSISGNKLNILAIKYNLTLTKK